MSKNLIYAHFVFVTKNRRNVITEDKERDLFAYIMSITKNLGGKLVRINAALNHVHLLVKLPTDISFSKYIAHVKRASSYMIGSTGLFPKFTHWTREYFVQTVSPADVESVRQYIIRQKEHHKVVSFEEEWVMSLADEDRSIWKWEMLDM